MKTHNYPSNEPKTNLEIVMQYQGTMMSTLMDIVTGAEKQISRSEKYPFPTLSLELLQEAPLYCEFEYGETRPGAGDAMPCGREAVGMTTEEESPRCRLHLNQ